jgi:transcriptional regulator with XRE-family HTH domain
MNRLGERIRKKREQLHLQLNDLAKKVGITSSALSQIENAKASPSLLTIKTIADCLNTTVGALIGEHEVLSRYPFIPYREKKFVKGNDSGAKLFLLSNHDTGKLIDTYFVIFEHHANSKDIITKHPGQEFFFIFSGKFEFETLQSRYRVSKGDSLYFNAGSLLNITNTSSGKSQLLWIISPPNI